MSRQLRSYWAVAQLDLAEVLRSRWLFFCVPKYRMPTTDEDIFVASLSEEFELGEPIPVDAWRP